MSRFGSMQDVAAAVEESGDLLPVSLGELREALGYNRLGIRVLNEIAEKLAGEGLGYFPLDVLSDRNDAPRYGDVVRVFKKGTALGQVVTSILEPTIPGDERLKEIAGSDAANILKSIRALLAQ